jgi:hypothetical protein
MKTRYLFLCFLLAACGSLHMDVEVYNPRQMTVEAPPAQACAGVFFFGVFTGDCPGGEFETVDAAFQAYDGGYMIWESSTGSIYILYNDGTGTVFSETQAATFPVTTISDLPPPAHFKPIRGFSRVWVHEEIVRQRLGWPYALEQAYTARVQEGLNMVFFELPNTQIIQFEASGDWHVVG